MEIFFLIDYLFSQELLLERRGANEQTVRISGFVEMDGVGLCEKRRPENGVCLAPIAIGVFDYFFRQGKK